MKYCAAYNVIRFFLFILLVLQPRTRLFTDSSIWKYYRYSLQYFSSFNLVPVTHCVINDNKKGPWCIISAPHLYIEFSQSFVVAMSFRPIMYQENQGALHAHNSTVQEHIFRVFFLPFTCFRCSTAWSHLISWPTWPLRDEFVVQVCRMVSPFSRS